MVDSDLLGTFCSECSANGRLCGNKRTTIKLIDWNGCDGEVRKHYDLTDWTPDQISRLFECLQMIDDEKPTSTADPEIIYASQAT